MNEKPSLFDLSDIDADIEAENIRHEDRMRRLLNAREYALERMGVPLAAAPHPSMVADAPVRAKLTYPKLDPNEYGGKKKLALRILDWEGSLSIYELTAACLKSGWQGVTSGNLGPQISAWKNVDGVVDLVDGRWSINQKGRDYLAGKN